MATETEIAGVGSYGLPIAFSPQDAEKAHAEWGANCGPAALAACLGFTLDEVRPHLGDFERKGYMNPTAMAGAIVSAGYRWYEDAKTSLPFHGVVRVQWGGPWMKPGVPPRVAYGFTHWVASKYLDRQQYVFDVNSGWETLADWADGTARRIMDSIKRCDGMFSFTHSWEVRKSGRL